MSGQAWQSDDQYQCDRYLLENVKINSWIGKEGGAKIYRACREVVDWAPADAFCSIMLQLLECFLTTLLNETNVY